MEDLFFRKVGEIGHPIVILHGVFGSCDNWLTVQKALAQEGSQVWAYDARNHGQSFWSDEFSYDAMATDLAHFIEKHQIDKPTVIGHSMGGKVLMQFSMSFESLISKMVVVDIAPKFYPTHHDHIIGAFNQLDLSQYQSRNAVEEAFAQYVPNFGERQFLLKNLGRNAEGQFVWKINTQVLGREIHQIGSELTDAHTVHIPAMFVRGELSPYIQPEDETAIHSIFTHATITTIEAAGHWVQADQPQEFVRVVKEFISI